MKLRHAALALVLLACGGDGGSAGGLSGVDGEKSLSRVSNDELQQICTAVETWASDRHMDEKLKEFGCRVRGSLAAALAPNPDDRQNACMMAYDPCSQAPSPTTSSGGHCSRPPATCTATVGELETCLGELVGVIDDLLTVLPTCDKLASSTSNPVGVALSKIPATCQALDMKCAGWDKLPGNAPAPQP